MIINGDLNLFKSSIKSLGNLKEVKGTLDISETEISFLPKDLIFNWVYFENSTLSNKFNINTKSNYSKKYLLEKYPQIFK